MHLGNHNNEFEYVMNGEKTSKVTDEKDLGVWVNQSLKPTKQCEAAALQANLVLRNIANSFHYRRTAILVPLYKTFVRPKLEYAVAAWSPWTENDIEVLENVQKRFIRLLSDKRGRTYEERLENAGLTTLKERRERGDLIEAFKVMTGINRVDKDDWFHFRKEEETRSTRSTTTITTDGETRKDNVLFMDHVRLEVRKNCYNVRVIKKWNALPEEVKSAKSLNAFKNAYDAWSKKQKLTP